MKSFIRKIISRKNSNNQLKVEGVFEKPSSSSIVNCSITIGKNAKLTLAENVSITGYVISIQKGELIIGEHTRLERGPNPIHPSISIENGTLTIGHHCIIRADFSIRFGGTCSIGCYTGIMEQTEIRADEKVAIGDFNMISYECMIYDTNTHVNYGVETRREMTKKDFPLIGLEREKPTAKSVEIGDDCWLGKRAVVLKGVKIENASTIATCAVVTKHVPANHIAYGNPAQNTPKSKNV
jgi:acetyltransferase-like isoleucine patch superfamily enzyme